MGRFTRQDNASLSLSTFAEAIKKLTKKAIPERPLYVKKPFLTMEAEFLAVNAVILGRKSIGKQLRRVQRRAKKR